MSRPILYLEFPPSAQGTYIEQCLNTRRVLRRLPSISFPPSFLHAEDQPSCEPPFNNLRFERVSYLTGKNGVGEKKKSRIRRRDSRRDWRFEVGAHLEATAARPGRSTYYPIRGRSAGVYPGASKDLVDKSSRIGDAGWFGLAAFIRPFGRRISREEDGQNVPSFKAHPSRNLSLRCRDSLPGALRAAS